MNITKIDAELFHRMLCGGAAALEAEKELINRLNVFPVPDGDTGSNMFLTLDSVRSMPLPSGSLSAFAEAAAKTVMRSARGNSGVILSLFFRGMAEALAGCEDADSAMLVNAIQRGSDSARKAVMKPMEGTILTVMRECTAFEPGTVPEDIESAMDEICEMASAILAKTPEMLPALKRAKVVDSGGKGFTVVLYGMKHALQGDFTFEDKTAAVESDENISDEGLSDADFSAFDADEIEFGFCTECLINRKEDITESDVDELRPFLNGIGDSVVMAADDEIVKIHVHTNEPMKVLERMMGFGVPQFVKIENMRQQHSTLVTKNEQQKLQGQTDDQDQQDDEKPEKQRLRDRIEMPKLPDKLEMSEIREKLEKKIKKEESEEPPEDAYGIITVVNGDGLRDLFMELGAGYVVEGGQSMNPSANDFLKAINELNCDKIILLPNNSNIVLTAEQAARMADEGIQVRVVRTVTIPQGISAMISFDSSAGIDENAEFMSDAASMVKSFAVTRAVRNADVENMHVKRRQFIGLYNNKLKYAEDTIEDCIRDIAEAIEDEEIITIYCGKGVRKDEAERTAELMQEILGDDREISVVNGKQPVYRYLISAE